VRRELGPVLDGLVLAKALGVWLEVSNLVIPTLHDQPGQVRELARWMARNLGLDTPLHFLGFHPQHRMRNLPPTPAETLATARQVALEEGLRYVYVGNALVEGGGTTFCPGCHAAVLVRQGFRVVEHRLRGGACVACDTPIAGVWR